MINRSTFSNCTKLWLSALDNIPGWLAPSSAYLSVALTVEQNKHKLFGNIAEIGVYHGKYLVGLATTINPSETVIAVDIFEDQEKNEDIAGYNELGSTGIYELNQNIFLNNLRKFAPEASCKLIARSSMDLSPKNLMPNGESIRFFSIDGGHSCNVFLNDLALAEATLAEYGVVSIDDIFNREWPGIVTGAVRYLDKSEKLRPVALINNKLLCSFEKYVEFYKKFLNEIAPESLLRKDVEFSKFSVDLYVDGPDIMREYNGLIS